MLPTYLRRLINDSGHPDRSKHCFKMATWLVKLGHSDEVTAAILLDPRLAISDKPRSRGRIWTAKLIGKARREARIPDPEA